MVQNVKGSTINHLGGRGAKRKIRSEGRRKKNSIFSLETFRINFLQFSPPPPDD